MTQLRPQARDLLAKFLYVHMSGQPSSSRATDEWDAGGPRPIEIERAHWYDRADQLLFLIAEDA